jgi:pyruvate dehydrogenase E1 component alpha subunit
VSVDPARYRDPAELSAALQDDPIALATARWLTRGADHDSVEALRRQAHAEIEQAQRAASEAAWPKPETALQDIQDTGAGQWF